MRADMSMRDRVETGQGMLFVSLLALGASWLWFQHTSAPSLWWVMSGVLTIGSVMAVGRSMQLIASGFSGFGRNFHEEREPPYPSVGDDSDVRDAAIGKEASHVWAGPLVVFVSGILATTFRLFPGLMTPDGIADPDFIPYHLLVLWIFGAGFTTIAWAALVLLMMRYGPDRWAYPPGTRPRIRAAMWKLLVLGVLLIAIATANTITSQSDRGSGNRQTAADLAIVIPR